MTLFVPEPVPRYQEGMLRYLDTSFERVRQAFSNLQRSTVGAATPSTGVAGQQFFNTTTKTSYIYDGTTWVPAGGNLPRCQSELAGGQTIPNNADTTINWASPNPNLGVTFTSPTTFTPTVKGWWQLEVSITVGFSGTGQRALYIYNNGVNVRSDVHATVSGTWNWPLNLSYTFYTTGSGNPLYVRVFQNSGAGQGMVANQSQFTLNYLGGGQ